MKRNSYKVVLNEFIANLKTISVQRGYEFFPEKIFGKLQTYILHIPNTTPPKRYFLFIHVSTIETGFWGVSLDWQEGIEKFTISRGNFDWAIVLLSSSNRGFLLPSKDFIEIAAGLSICHNRYIKIEEKHIPLRYEFYNWNSFFQLLNLD